MNSMLVIFRLMIAFFFFSFQTSHIEIPEIISSPQSSIMYYLQSANSSTTPIRNFNQKDDYKSKANSLRASISPSETLYFSSRGNDKNDGLSSSSPKKDPTVYIKKGNCQCLLKSGDVFSFDSTITAGSNLVISTYGGSERAGLSFIRTTRSKLKVYDKTNNIYSVSLNSADTDLGWISIDGIINWKRKLDFNLEKNNEYYCDLDKHIIYIKSKEDLSGKQISYSYSGHGLYIWNQNSVVVENIEIAGTGWHGISLAWDTDIIVQNCYIHDVGGAIASGRSNKYGNGIQIWANDCHNIYIYKNIVTDCFDAGLTAQINSAQQKNSSDLFFINNLVERCNYGFESFHTSTDYYMKNLVVANNIFYDSKDITNGYRLTVSSTDYTAHLCLWDYSNLKSSIKIKNNFGFKTQTNAISYSLRSKVVPAIKFSGNTLVTENIAINFPANYTGDDSQYLIVTDSAQMKQNEKLIARLEKNYSFSQLVKTGTATEPIKIKCIGDSVTEGLSLDDHHTAVLGGSTYPSILYSLLNDNGIEAIVENAGHGGEDTASIGARIGKTPSI